MEFIAWMRCVLWKTCRAYQLAVTSGERLQVQRVWREREQAHPAGSDAWAIANGFISLTRLRLLRDAGHETFVWRDAQVPHPIPVFTAGIGLNAAPSPNDA